MNILHTSMTLMPSIHYFHFSSKTIHASSYHPNPQIPLSLRDIATYMIRTLPQASNPMDPQQEEEGGIMVFDTSIYSQPPPAGMKRVIFQ